MSGEVKEGDLPTFVVEDPAALRSSSEGSGSGVITQDAAENWLSRLDDKPECAAGHLLIRFGTPEPNWTCSSCLREFRDRTFGGADFAISIYAARACQGATGGMARNRTIESHLLKDLVERALEQTYRLS